MRYLTAGVLLLGLAIFAFLIFSPLVRIREIQVHRLSPRLDIEQVQLNLESVFGQHLFFLSGFEVAEKLKETNADIRQVNIRKEYPSTLHVEIELDPLVSMLRIVRPDEDTESFGTGAIVNFLTDQGVYVNAITIEDALTLPEIVLVDWGVHPTHGDLLIEPTFLERMNAAEMALLRQFGQVTLRRTVFLRAQEFHLAIDEIELWFDLSSPLEDQLQRYRTFLQHGNLDDVKQYIDLRIAGRVVYQ